MNDRRCVFHNRSKPNIWPKKDLALGRIPKPNVQIYVKIGGILLWIEVSNVCWSVAIISKQVYLCTNYQTILPLCGAFLAEMYAIIRRWVIAAKCMGIELTLQFYIQLVYKPTLSFTLRIQIVSGCLLLTFILNLKQKFIFFSLLC